MSFLKPTLDDYYKIIYDYDQSLSHEEIRFAAQEAMRLGLYVSYDYNSSDISTYSTDHTTNTELKIGNETIYQVVARMPQDKIDLNGLVSSLNSMVDYYTELTDEEVKKNAEQALRNSIVGLTNVICKSERYSNKTYEIAHKDIDDEDDEFHETMSSRRHH